LPIRKRQKKRIRTWLVSSDLERRAGYGFFASYLLGASDAHGHEDVTVFVLGVGVFGAHLAGGLAVFEFESYFAFVAEGLEEVEHVAGVESHYERVAGVGGFDGVFGFAGFVGLGGDFELVLLHLDADGSAALVGELGYAADGGG